MKLVNIDQVPAGTKAIFYICKFHHQPELRLELKRVAFYNSVALGLDIYANFPNPESQLITGETREELTEALEIFGKQMVHEEWLDMLNQSI